MTAQGLWAIGPESPAPPMRVMAPRLHCNASNLAFIAKQFEDRGCVEGRRDPQLERARLDR